MLISLANQFFICGFHQSVGSFFYSIRPTDAFLKPIFHPCDSSIGGEDYKI